MRFLTLDSGSDAGAVLRALAEPGPLELRLLAPPRDMARLALLSAVASADGPSRARFAGRLVSPLTEIACLCGEAIWSEGAELDFTGALLGPLLGRVGPRRAMRLLLPGRLRIAAGEILSRFPEPEGRRSPLALRAVVELTSWPSSAILGMAREKAAFRLVMGGPDRTEGLLAFRSRRAPTFPW
ncbi:MAG: hypothetical protein ABIT01_16845 [Thermoanaerobaculia bacterium]